MLILVNEKLTRAQREVIWEKNELFQQKGRLIFRTDSETRGAQWSQYYNKLQFYCQVLHGSAKLKNNFSLAVLVQSF